MKEEEGVIKFRCELWSAPPLSEELLKPLQEIRQLLYAEKLIGQGEDGIGYGNISMRLPHRKSFVITASGTGGLPHLLPEHFAEVESADIDNNTVHCRGTYPASSETMTHAAVYAALPGADCVVHVHSAELWQRGLAEGWPCTPADIPYGTPAMAYAVQDLCKNLSPALQYRIVMAGHQDGLLFIGMMGEWYEP